MISTITTTTINIISASVFAPLLPAITIVLLLVLLVQKEISSGLDTARAQQLSSALNIVLIPLLFASGFILIIRFMQVLR